MNRVIHNYVHGTTRSAVMTQLQYTRIAHYSELDLGKQADRDLDVKIQDHTVVEFKLRHATHTHTRCESWQSETDWRE